MRKGWRKLALAPFVVSLGAYPCQADGADFAGMLLTNQSLLSNPPASCEAKDASLNTFEMQQCAAVAFKKADESMNRAFQDVLKAGDGARDTKLRQAQRLWLTLRNAECDWESSKYSGGTLAPVVMGNCLVDVTRERTKRLQRDLEP